MYSKDRGVTYREGVSHGRSPAYRQPVRPRMQVPANYRGNAIVDGEERPLGHMADHSPVPDGGDPSMTAEAPVPTFDHLPRVSELGRASRPRSEAGYLPEPAIMAPADSFFETRAEAAAEAAAVPAAEESCAPLDAEVAETALGSVTSRVDAAATRLFAADRFPFGHGLGFEELLILGLILLLLYENADRGDRFDRGDLDETLILLGLLLFLG